MPRLPDHLHGILTTLLVVVLTAATVAIAAS
jgi:hypothetical protein